MDPICRRIEEHRQQRRLPDALREVCAHFSARSSDPTFLALAAKTIVTFADSDATSRPEWHDDAARQLIRSLARQDLYDGAPPALAHAIAASTIIPRSHRALALALEGPLAELANSDDLNANAVVTLLTIREHAGRLLSQALVTGLHRVWLPRFEWQHLSLIYNSMFTYSAFRRNILDLRSFAQDTRYDHDHLSAAHHLMLSWVLGRDTLPPARLPAISNSAIRSARPDQLRSARTLCLRHAGDPDAMRALRQLLEGSEELRDAADFCAHRRRRVSVKTAPRLRWRTSLIEKRWWQGVQFVAETACSTLRLRRGRGRPRVAVCVSGQLRGYQQAWPTWTRHLLNGVEPVLFVHTWSRVGNSDPSPHRASLPFEGRAFQDTWRRVGLRESMPAMEARYPSLFQALVRTASVSADEIQALYNARRVAVDDESLDRFREWSNQDKMHYKIETCFRFLDSETDAFDLVLRIRPDLPVRRKAFNWRDLAQRCHDSPIIFTEREYGQQYGHLMIGDQFAVGSPSTMRAYCEAWSDAPRLWKAGALSTHCPFVGHVTLAESCWLAGIEVRRVPLSFGTLRDMSPLGRQVIRQSLLNDARDRMDRVDIELLEAVEQC